MEKTNKLYEKYFIYLMIKLILIFQKHERE